MFKPVLVTQEEMLLHVNFVGNFGWRHKFKSVFITQWVMQVVMRIVKFDFDDKFMQRL